MNAPALAGQRPQPPLHLYPLNFVRLGKVALAVFGALCTSLLISLLFSTKSDSGFALNSMLLLACVLQLMAAVFQGQALGRGVSVLQIQRAPAALWHAWLRQWLLSVSRYWAILSVALAMLMATPASQQHWLAAPALLSLLLCACVTAAMARAGLLPRRLGMAVEAALLALPVLAAAAGQVMAPLERFAMLPMLILAPCTLAWPAMAYWIMQSQADALRSVTGSQTNVLRRVRDAIARWAGRFQPLRDNASNASAQPLNRRTLLAVAVIQNVIFFAQLVPVQWGEQATGLRLSRLAMICVIGLNALLVRDLHWRVLLMPGGTQLRHIGTRIVLSTMLFQAPLVLAFTVGSVLLSPQAWGQEALASMAVPLMELACCTTLMTLIRTFPRQLQVGASMALAIPMLYFTLWSMFKLDLPQLTWQIGPAYALLLATVTGAALVIANRRWTPARLLNALSTGLGK